MCVERSICKKAGVSLLLSIILFVVSESHGLKPNDTVLLLSQVLWGFSTHLEWANLWNELPHFDTNQGVYFKKFDQVIRSINCKSLCWSDLKHLKCKRNSFADGPLMKDLPKLKDIYMPVVKVHTYFIHAQMLIERFVYLHAYIIYREKLAKGR